MDGKCITKVFENQLETLLFHVAEEASREFSHFETPIEHHNAIVRREAYREMIRCFLDRSSPDQLKPLAKLFENHDGKSRAELVFERRISGKMGWVLRYSDRWRQGGYREIEEIKLGFPFLEMPESVRDQEVLALILKGKPSCD
jgi:hypothetical protein